MQAPPIPKQTPFAASVPHHPERIGPWAYLAWVLVPAVMYALVGFLNEGFYQQDEAAHYLDMRAFWYEPGRIVHNWNKFGYKLLTVVPALGGRGMLVAFHALVAGITVALTGSLAQTAGVLRPRLAMLLVATQTFFVQLAFRTYAEVPSALLLLLLLHVHLRRQWVWAGCLAGVLLLFRQEFYPFVALYGVYLLVHRRWQATLAVVAGPLLHHVAGWVATGDPLFLFNEVLGMQAKLAAAYPRQGFWHYARTSEAIFGALTLVGLFAWLGTLVGGAWQPNRLKLLPLLLVSGSYFLLHSLFNLQAIPIGPSTGGNLRYLVVIGPLLAVLAAEGYGQVHAGRARGWALALVGCWVALVGFFLTYQDNLVVLTHVRDLNPLLHTAMGVLVLIGPLARNFHTLVLGVVGVYCLYQALHLPPLTSEDRLVRAMAEWGALQPPETPLFATHPLFFYYQDRPAAALPGARTRMTAEGLSAAPSGTYILFDSHYSYRPQLDSLAVPLRWFQAQDSVYRLLRTERTPERHFQVWLIQKQ